MSKTRGLLALFQNAVFVAPLPRGLLRSAEASRGLPMLREVSLEAFLGFPELPEARFDTKLR